MCIDFAVSPGRLAEAGAPAVSDEILGRRLFEEMERLDPSPEESSWDSLSDREKTFFSLCAKAVKEFAASQEAAN